jgi:hypothetical protein
MTIAASDRGQSDAPTSSTLELCVQSLAALVKQRAHERDLARLERDLATRERDTVRMMLSVALELLHVAGCRQHHGHFTLPPAQADRARDGISSRVST